ncbi:MAG: sodium-dependent bicarbonate transport family permease, partial [Methanosarcinales archaeon]|nr:sodium-dependent bicarbonate transport family permease [Methanosarcinales archaeon]
LGSKLGIAVLIAFILPQLWGVIGILGVFAIHYMVPGMLGWGDAFVFATIAGGCSFISAPAAMRASIPEANPSIYLPMAVALTFPVNIIVGMPLWQVLSMTLWGSA